MGGHRLLFITVGVLAIFRHTSADSPTIKDGIPSLANPYGSSYTNDDDFEPEFELVNEMPGSQTQKVIQKDVCAQYHKVQFGDTCLSVSKRYNIHVGDLYDWNPQINDDCTNLYYNKMYCVKSAEDTENQNGEQTCERTHQVIGLETCSSIAKEYNMSLKAFFSLNPNLDPASCPTLEIGKKICVLEDSAQPSTASGTQVLAKRGKEKRKKLQSKSDFTYYWIAKPHDYGGSGKKVTIRTCSGQVLGKVSETYAKALIMEGTGLLGGSILNLGGCHCSNYRCFETLNVKSDPFGVTSYGSSLLPYVTVAMNDIKKGTKIYVPQLVGWTLPGTKKKHNGCLFVDDQSWSFGGHHMDFYVYNRDYYDVLDGKHGVNEVDIYEGGSCKLQSYI